MNLMSKYSKCYSNLGQSGTKYKFPSRSGMVGCHIIPTFKKKLYFLFMTLTLFRKKKRLDISIRHLDVLIPVMA